jgi:hypothetical protein
MSLHVFVFLLVGCLLLSLVLLWRLDWFPLRPPSSRGGAKCTTLHRLLKPRSPDNCPACRLGSTPTSGGGQLPAPVRPWSEMKSRRGAPKRILTEGYACPNQQCAYFGITEDHIHALVGDGKHGYAERIQTFRCQACHTTFSARRNTPLYRLKTPSHHIAMVLSALGSWARPFRCRTGLRVSSGYHHHLAHARWAARAHLPRALFPQPQTSAPAVGRTAH